MKPFLDSDIDNVVKRLGDDALKLAGKKFFWPEVPDSSAAVGSRASGA